MSKYNQINFFFTEYQNGFGNLNKIEMLEISPNLKCFSELKADQSFGFLYKIFLSIWKVKWSVRLLFNGNIYKK